MQNKKEIRRLNSIRGIAVLVVLVSHYSNESGIWGGILGQGAGQIGVMLFFILSAFLMSYLYFDSVASKSNLRSFAVARIARVLPLFLIVVVLSYLFKKMPFQAIHQIVYGIPHFFSLLSHVMLFSGTSVLWTIPPEIQFYAIFAVVWAMKRYFGDLVLLLPVGLILFFIFSPTKEVFDTNIFGVYFRFTLGQVYPFFCVGALLGVVYRRWRAPQAFVSKFYFLFIGGIPLLYPLIFAQLTGFTHSLWEDSISLVGMSLIFFAVVFLVPDKFSLLENDIGDYLGKISYSVYLLHYPVLLFLKKIGLAQEIWGGLLFFGVALATAHFSYTFIEVPCQKIVRNRL